MMKRKKKKLIKPFKKNVDTQINQKKLEPLQKETEEPTRTILKLAFNCKI